MNTAESRKRSIDAVLTCDADKDSAEIQEAITHFDIRPFYGSFGRNTDAVEKRPRWKHEWYVCHVTTKRETNSSWPPIMSVRFGPTRIFRPFLGLRASLHSSNVARMRSIYLYLNPNGSNSCLLENALDIRTRLKLDLTTAMKREDRLKSTVIRVRCQTMATPFKSTRYTHTYFCPSPF